MASIYFSLNSDLQPKSVSCLQKLLTKKLFIFLGDQKMHLHLSLRGEINIWSCHKGIVFYSLSVLLGYYRVLKKVTFLFFLYLQENKRNGVDGKQWLIFSSLVSSLYLVFFSALIGIFNWLCPVNLSWELFWIYFTSFYIFTTHWTEDRTLPVWKLIPGKETNSHMQRNTKTDLKADKYTTEIKDEHSVLMGPRI